MTTSDTSLPTAGDRRDPKGNKGSRYAARTLVYVLICCAVAVIGVQQLFAQVPFYYNHFVEGWNWDPLSNPAENPVDGALLDFRYARQLLMVWLPLLVIALLAICLMNRPLKAQAGDFQVSEDTKDHLSFPQLQLFALRQAKLFFTYQLPPRDFWSRMSANGFSVVDALLVLTWLLFNGMWLGWGYHDRYAVLQTYLEETGEHEYGSKFGDRCQSLAFASAWAAVYNLIFVMIPLPRNTFLQYLFDTDFTYLIRYHRWLGNGTLLMCLLHGVTWYLVWLDNNEWVSQTFQWTGNSVNFLAGTLAMFPFGLLLWVAAIPWLRTRCFKIFRICHLAGFVGFVVFSVLHFPQTMYYMPGLVLYLLDLTFRIAQWKTSSRIQCTFISEQASFITLKLCFSQAARVRPGQFLFVNVPTIDRTGWHPFTIAHRQLSDDGLTQDLYLHIKPRGAWTKELCNLLREESSAQVRCDGPYGSLRKSVWQSYKHLILVSGGVGVTPILGVLREINRRHKDAEKAGSGGGTSKPGWPAGVPRRVDFVWAVRKRDELQLLDQELLDVAGDPEGWLKLGVYHTQKLSATPPSSSSSCQTTSRDLQPCLCSKTLKIDEASDVQPIPALGFGDLHWAMAHVLAMVGAASGLIAASAFQYRGYADGVDRDRQGIPRGHRIELIALLYIVGMLAGAVVLPALIIFPFHVVRHYQQKNACLEAWKRKKDKDAEHVIEIARSRALSLDVGQVDQILPRKVGAGGLDLEAGKTATVHQGRPDLDYLIRDLAMESLTQSQGYPDVAVIASGPESLCRDARIATHKASQAASQAALLPGIPEIPFAHHGFSF